MKRQHQGKIEDQGDIISKFLLRLDALEKQMDEKDNKISKFEKRVDQYGSDFWDLKKHVSSLEERLVQQERYASTDCLVFHIFCSNPTRRN